METPLVKLTEVSERSATTDKYATRDVYVNLIHVAYVRPTKNYGPAQSLVQMSSEDYLRVVETPAEVFELSKLK